LKYTLDLESIFTGREASTKMHQNQFSLKTVILTLNNKRLEAVRKRRPRSGGRGFIQCGHFSDKGVLQVCTAALFGE